MKISRQKHHPSHLRRFVQLFGYRLATFPAVQRNLDPRGATGRSDMGTKRILDTSTEHYKDLRLNFQIISSKKIDRPRE